MQAADPIVRLLDALEAEARVMHALVAELERHRTAYLSAKPSVLEASLASLETQRRSADQLEQTRIEVSRQAAQRLGLRPDARLKKIVAAAPAALRARLERAGADLRVAARKIQIESRVGARLLDSSRRAHELMVHDLLGARSERSAGSYDRYAHTIAGQTRAGSLISGTA